MRIAFYICTLNIGGAERIVVDYLINLKKRNNDVFLIENQYTSSFLSKVLEKESITICNLSTIKGNGWLRRLFRKIDLLLFGKRRFDKYIKHYEPDIIHIHSFSPIISRIDFSPDKLFFTIHSSLDRHKKMVENNGIKKIKTLFDAGMKAICISKESEKEIASFYKPKRSYYVPNGVSFKKIVYQRYDKSFLTSLGIHKTAFIVGHIGRFNPVKNHERIIDVFNEIVKIHSDSYLLLIGGDELNRMKEIKERACRYSLEEKVKVLGTKEDATSIMGCFDVLLFPSISECMPLTIIEAQILGIRCVVSDSLPSEIICNENCIRMSLDETNQRWATAVMSLDYKNTNRNDITVFDINNVITRLISVYCEK